MTEAQPQTGFLDVQGAPLYYEVAGSGYPLLLIHAGVADSRMWDDQFQTFALQYRVMRYDLRGFGRSVIPDGPFSNYEDIYALLRHLGIERTHVIAISFGGLVAIDFTLAHPEMVTSLVLGAPSVSGREDSSTDVLRFAGEEEAMLERGDLAGAAELNVRTWVVGLRRTPDQVDPSVRQRIYDMQYHAFTVPIPENAEELSLEPPAISRLAEIQVPTLLMVGEYDLQDKHDINKQLAAEIPQAQQVVIPNAAHIVSMERPAEFNRIVLEFLKNSPI